MAKSQGPSLITVPPGDNRERLVCPDCGFIDYQNPRIVVGAVCEWDGRILMCRRSIEPRRGYWTIPAGFLELGETPVEGAAREVREEACATVEPKDLLGVYDIPHVGHVYMIFRAPMVSADHGRAESEETQLMDWPDIPWDDLAFSSVHWALREYRDLGAATEFSARLDGYRRR